MRNDQASAASLRRDLRARVLDLTALLEAAREPHHRAELARRLEAAEKTLNRVGKQPMTEKTDQTEASRYQPIKPPSPELALVQARSRMNKAWAHANETMAEFFELDGRPNDAREARTSAKAEWREAAKHDREALKLIESAVEVSDG